jgi:hypothetical protein
MGPNVSVSVRVLVMDQSRVGRFNDAGLHALCDSGKPHC